MSALEERGSVYLNPTYDTFVTGLDFRLRYATKLKRTLNDADGDIVMTDANADADDFVVSRPMTEALPAKACLQIQNIVLAECGLHPTGKIWVFMDMPYEAGRPYIVILEPANYTRLKAESVWNRSIFSRCTTFQHLWVTIPLRERGFGERLGLNMNGFTRRVEGRSICAWALLQQLQKFGLSRRCLDVRKWSMDSKENQGQVSEQKGIGYLAEPTIMRFVSSYCWGCWGPL